MLVGMPDSPTPRAIAAPGPMSTAERSLAPDLARGAMLLLIALAHTRILHPGGAALEMPGGPGPVDDLVQVVLTTLVDGRAYPMFAALYGYGLVQIFRRGTARGQSPDEARRLLRRRGRWLVVFGIAHATLLYAGDILAAYGLLALLMAGAVRWADRRLAVVGIAGALAGAMWFGALQVLLGESGEPRPPADLLVGALQRLGSVVLIAPMSAVMAIAPMMAGIWAARNGLLDEPWRHVRVLRRVALLGLPLAVAGAMPMVARFLGWWSPDSGWAQWGSGALHTLTGIGGGLGYAALIGLVVVRLGARRGPVTNALVAVGRRSMTCYLLQSVGWFVLTEPLLGDLFGRLGVAAAAAVGVAIWLLTVGFAVLLARYERRGPAETLLRRLTYRGVR
ncbi:putative membrane protein YeiB [Nocardia puris]|uniref:Putative membrane protein YeiB n=2 Tax=Nocardia puris TaxID=208602 RepID=A0A366DR41_9NOCA|nr:putative membrane protein YeiB [Nocardia puris]